LAVAQQVRAARGAGQAAPCLVGRDVAVVERAARQLVDVAGPRRVTAPPRIRRDAVQSKSINQSIYPSIHQSINQSINQSIK